MKHGTRYMIEHFNEREYYKQSIWKRFRIKLAFLVGGQALADLLALQGTLLIDAIHWKITAAATNALQSHHNKQSKS